MLDLNPTTFEDFERDCECGSVIPVTRTILADLQTPLGAFLRIAGDAQHSFLLESIEGGERVARYSFLGANPWMVLRGQRAKTIIQRDGRREVVNQNAIDFLRQYFAGKKLVSRSGLAPFAGGAVGYLAYDAARWFEPVLDSSSDQPNANDAVWMLFRTVIAFDRVRQQMEITAVVFTNEADGDREKLRALYHEAVDSTAKIAASLNGEIGPFADQSACSFRVESTIDPDWSFESS